MRSCTNCRPSWPPGPAPASSADNPSTPTPGRRPNEALLAAGRGSPAPSSGDRLVLQGADHPELARSHVPLVLVQRVLLSEDGSPATPSSANGRVARGPAAGRSALRSVRPVS